MAASAKRVAGKRLFFSISVVSNSNFSFVWEVDHHVRRENCHATRPKWPAFPFQMKIKHKKNDETDALRNRKPFLPLHHATLYRSHSRIESVVSFKRCDAIATKYGAIRPNIPKGVAGRLKVIQFR